jgi:hypothetical protein
MGLLRAMRVDHGSYGFEAQFFTNEEPVIGRTFHQRFHPERTRRVMAIAWAEADCKAKENGR